MQKYYAHIYSYWRLYVIICLAATFFALCFVLYQYTRPKVLTIAFLDVGQGDAIFIESPAGTQVLVDGGPGRSVLSAISEVLPLYDRHIDTLVVTNPDKDHFEGFIPLLEKYSTDLVVEPGTVGKTPEYKHFKENIAEKGIKQLVAQRGQVVDLGGGATLTILFPDRDISGLSSNDGSIVMRLSYGSTSVMLQGDSTARMEEFLLNTYGVEQSDILKVGHHGSQTSSSREYVAQVSPKYAIISAGKDNDYGHPHQEVLDVLKSEKVTPLATCTMGTIVFVSDGEKWELKTGESEVVSGCK